METEENLRKTDLEKKKYKRRVTTQYALPSDQTRIENLIQILKAYCIASDNGAAPVSYREITTITNLGLSRISDNNKFLEENGLLQKKGRGIFVPSPEIVAFSKSLPWDPDKAKHHLRNSIVESWFVKTINKAFALESKRTEQELVNALGKIAGAKEDQVIGLKRILELLEYANIIEKDQSGGYSLAKELVKLVGELHPDLDQFYHKDFEGDTVPAIKHVAKKNLYAESKKFSIPINININLTVSANSFDADVEKVKKFFQELKNFLTQENIE